MLFTDGPAICPDLRWRVRAINHCGRMTIRLALARTGE